MTDFKKPKNDKDFEKNFAQINPMMTESEALVESMRCLFCYDAPCIKACPTKIDIPLFIRQIGTGNLTGSARTVYESNYFGNACGKVCPVEVLCEGACVYNLVNEKPIEIGRLQSYAATFALSKKLALFKPGKPAKKRVAIIGAGPAGISCACELRRFGYEVDIFEAKKKPTGLTLHGVAPYKITNEEALKEAEYLRKQLGFRIIYNTPVTKYNQFKKLEAEYDSIFIGIGLGNTVKLKIKGEDLNGCIGAVDYIEDIKLKKYRAKSGRKVVVIGGGNTAMDAASEASRMGAERVWLSYRRSRAEMPAYEFEYELAKNVCVEPLFNTMPLEIKGGKNVEAIVLAPTKSIKGKMSVDEASAFVIPCDMVIIATGQEKQNSLLDIIDGFEFDAEGKPIVEESTFRAKGTRYFIAGDVINGGSEIVNAVAEAVKAAEGIHNFLSKKK
jgi:glutamate synthase (NADPH/NADH) small chain